jgi:hypothetical protein
MKDLRIRLLELHRTLLDAVRRDYEREHGRLTPAEFLQRLVADEELAWLRPFTSSIVRLDEQLDADEPAPVRELRELLDPEREDAPFQRHYGEWIQASPEVAYAHCTTQQLLAAP